jgi:hypothetical protein
VPCADPHWTAYVSALGTPIVALIAGGWGGYIAWRQWRTTQNRLRFDLFDKRFAAYAAARDVMERCSSLNDEEIAGRFVSNAREAQWTLGKDIADYLEHIVAPMLFELTRLNKRELNLHGFGDELVQLVATKAEVIRRLIEQIDVLADKYSDRLQLRN